MAYVAVRGGREAIENAADFFRYEQLKTKSTPLEISQIEKQLHLVVDRIISEGGVYAPDLAALAFKQTAGDTFEASFMLRAFATTQARVGYSLPCDTGKMRVIRRISAAFKDIPGGQVLGPTSDYLLRLLNFELVQENSENQQKALNKIMEKLPNHPPAPQKFSKVVDILDKEGLLVKGRSENCKEPFDATREAITFPAPRSATLQVMARAETGGLLALAYSNMRGFGMVHPTVGELRVGYLPVEVDNPYTNDREFIGEIKVTEAEIISEHRDSTKGSPKFTLGYGLCFGHNETKAISMAVLDRAIQTDEPSAACEDQEFVLLHTDGVESVGFCNHFKLPHYVTFQSALDRLRKAQGLSK